MANYASQRSRLQSMSPPRRADPELERVTGLLVRAVREWFEAESRGREIAIGIANGGLHLVECFRVAFPLSSEDFASRRASQVKGLSGPSGDRIIARFLKGMSSIGTEAGRTSRGTLPAVGLLADRLNGIAEARSLTPRQRARAADEMQRWLIENPIKAYFQRQKLAPSLDPRRATAANVVSILSAARERNQAGPVAQHVVGAKLALRFPDMSIENFGYSAADAAGKRPGDFVVNRAVFHVTMAPSMLVLRKCKRNIRDGYRPLLLVPEDRKAGTTQMAESMGLGPEIGILAIEAFVGQNLEEIAEFQEFGRLLRRLLEIYNDRVAQAEPDPSLLIEIPDRLGR